MLLLGPKSPRLRTSIARCTERYILFYVACSIHALDILSEASFAVNSFPRIACLPAKYVCLYTSHMYIYKLLWFHLLDCTTADMAGGKSELVGTSGVAASAKQS